MVKFAKSFLYLHFLLTYNSENLCFRQKTKFNNNFFFNFSIILVTNYIVWNSYIHSPIAFYIVLGSMKQHFVSYIISYEVPTISDHLQIQKLLWNMALYIIYIYNIQFSTTALLMKKHLQH